MKNPANPSSHSGEVAITKVARKATTAAANSNPFRSARPKPSSEPCCFAFFSVNSRVTVAMAA